MIHLSLIYAAFTALLALVDAIRIKIQWGLRDNINHDASLVLAGIAAVVAVTLDFHLRSSIWVCILYGLLAIPVCALVRLATFNIFLNAIRIPFKINPTNRLDYVSSATSSEVDTIKWWAKIPFWWQRGIAAAGWAILVFVYYKITNEL